MHDALNTVIGHTVTPAQPDEQRVAWRAVNAALKEADRTVRSAAVVRPRTSPGRASSQCSAALYRVVDVWRDPAITAADQRAISHATANQTWEESPTIFLAQVEKVMQTFGRD
ncbi:hypothetical protein ACWDCC_43595 [Streptomyces sp. NPDC001102]